METDNTSGQTYRVVVPSDMGAVRVDRALAGLLGTHAAGRDAVAPAALSRSRLKQLIEAGRVTCDGILVREPADPVIQGATYAVALPPIVDAVPKPEAIALNVLFEDAHLIVLDKPAGLVTHPAPGNLEGTLVNALLAHCGESLTGIGGERRPGIVHRLDKDTSGVMVAAKSEMVLAALSADFAARRLERSYLALAWGLPSLASGTWTGAIGRDPRDRKRMAIVSHGGKHATTHYQRLAALGLSVSLMRVTLETGRTHQIRVHAAAHGHPLVGDPVYLKRMPALARALGPAEAGPLLGFGRQALHAERLGFRHPVTGAAMLFKTGLPADMQALLGAIGLALPVS